MPKYIRAVCAPKILHFVLDMNLMHHAHQHHRLSSNPTSDLKLVCLFCMIQV